MIGGLLPLLVLLSVPATLVLVLVMVPRRRSLVAVEAAALPGLLRLRRATVVGRLLGLGTGALLIVPVASLGGLGRGLMLVPATFAAVQIAGVLFADVVARNAARVPGVAGLEVRVLGDFLPRRLVRYTALAATALVTLMAWTTAVADPDDLGRAGRSFRHGCTAECGAGDVSRAFGPWPGSFYSAPLAVALLLVVLFAGAALWVTVRRPRNGADSEIARVDDVIRRRSAESVVAGVGIAVGGSLAGLGFFAGPALAVRDVGSVLQATGLLITGGALAAVVLTVWCVVVLLLPGAGTAGTPSDSAGSTGAVPAPPAGRRG